MSQNDRGSFTIPHGPPPYLRQLVARSGVSLDEDVFPGSLGFIKKLHLDFSSAVSIFVGENGCGKSTVIEAIAELCGLPAAGGGRNELADPPGPQKHSELAPYVRANFRRRPPSGYFFRAEYQAHFAALLEKRRLDPDFLGDPYIRYGGRPLHTRSHGEAFLSVLRSWLTPGIILMDEPESALSPQRQLALLTLMWDLVRRGRTQIVIATHSPIIMTFPYAQIVSFDQPRLAEIRLEDTAHYAITRGILERPEKYWREIAGPGSDTDDCP
jgi:predicted ATPase